MNEKALALEYILDHLIEWFKEEFGENASYKISFTKLKVLKLLFFVSSVNANEEEHGLLDVFDNYVAMPFGPVESDIYNYINDGDIGKYQISDRQFLVNADYRNGETLSEELQTAIDESINALKEINPKLICYTPFELVDLSHKWSCWQVAMNFANMLGKKSVSIPTETIIRSDKYYKL